MGSCMSTLVSSTNNLVGPLFFLVALVFWKLQALARVCWALDLQAQVQRGAVGPDSKDAHPTAFLPQVFWQMQAHCLGKKGAPIFFQI